MKAFNVTRPDYLGVNCVYRDVATLIDSEFSDAEPSSVIQVQLLEMTEEQFDALPEFEGW